MDKHFELRPTVHENVEELRRALGSAVRELSLAGLAKVLNERDGRQRSASSIQRWEEGAEPDYASTKLMAELAGVTFEEFALGAARLAPSPMVRAGKVPGEEKPAAARRRGA